ncbi:lysogenization regulator HflD [Alteromonas sediminis]|uniref:High frequency lysogenization protein HflD homolog n=1 Tax=Alteromonas sediminis TaxID=2259342 RepID=A0A3N5YQZ2_9ALTE|nr:high frequency lysogenization protein HflD [Alteromonas sediminis]RPJ68731.1 lysogenization regulator HflD [Alteromonas sediminis]
MLAKNIEAQLALAGVCQAATLVQNIARKGEFDKLAFESSLSSILVTEPDTPQQVFGSLSNLRMGFSTLLSQLDNHSQQKDTELTRYIASILGLERKLTKHPKALAELGDRINHVQRQLAYVEVDNDQVISSLASIYTDIVSPLAPKIQIAGSPAFLKQSINQHRVRALLLAGVRAAFMWRQMGGKRRNILFQRKHIVHSAREALRLIQ